VFWVPAFIRSDICFIMADILPHHLRHVLHLFGRHLTASHHLSHVAHHARHISHHASHVFHIFALHHPLPLHHPAHSFFPFSHLPLYFLHLPHHHAFSLHRHAFFHGHSLLLLGQNRNRRKSR